LGHLRAEWVFVALVAEAASMLAFARLQQILLRSGGSDIPFAPMAGITLAGNAMAMSLPGGSAFSLAWSYGRLRKRGATSRPAGPRGGGIRPAGRRAAAPRPAVALGMGRGVRLRPAELGGRPRLPPGGGIGRQWPRPLAGHPRRLRPGPAAGVAAVHPRRV